MRVTADGDSSVMSTPIQSVQYGPFIQKIECANHACKCYRSRLEAFAKDHPQFCGKGGLTKRAIQRLTVGAQMAIKMHSRTGCVRFVDTRFVNSQFVHYFCTSIAYSQPQAV